MLVNPITTHAKQSAALLDAAAHSLDGNIVIQGVSHRSTRAIAVEYRGDVRKMAQDAVRIAPSTCPDDVLSAIKTESGAIETLAKTTGMYVPYLFSSAQRAVGSSGYPSLLKRDPLFNRRSRTSGLVHHGPSTLGVSCPFVVRDSGFAATRGFWIDNLTGLSAADWLAFRAESLNYISDFSGGPWDGQELTDSTILSAAVQNSDVFADYAAQRFGVQDARHGMRFRFSWTRADHSLPRGSGRRQHSQSDDIASFQSWIEHEVM